MTPTDDAVKLLPEEEKRWFARASLLVKILTLVVPALAAVIGSGVLAYRSATDDAKVTTQAAKNKAEAGYQVTKEAMEALEGRVLQLEQAQRQVVGDLHRRRGAARRVPVAVPAASAKVLPADLDKAEHQVYRGAGAVPDAGPPRSP